MARTKEFDETEALESAMRVFCENGYEGTSLQDLEQAMGLNRTSIYNAFGNKRSIFNQVLACYVEAGRQCWEAVLAETPSARKAIENILNMAVDKHFDKETSGGCLVTLSALEKNQHDHLSQKMVEQALHTFQQMILEKLKTAKKEGELKPDLDALGTATTITSIFSGFIVLGKANFSKSAMRKAVQTTLRLLDKD